MPAMGAEHRHGPDHSSPPRGAAITPAGTLSDAERVRAARQVTVVGAVLRAFLAATEISIGLWTGSRALVADALHTVSDLLSDGIVWLALRFGAKPADTEYPFGRGKVEPLAALSVALLLGIAGVVIAVEAGLAVVHGAARHFGPWPMVGAALGIVVQEISFRWTNAVGQRIGSPMLVANAWHHRSDVLSSLAALLGVAGAALLGWPWLDAAAAAVVAVFVLRMAFGIGRESAKHLLDAALDPRTVRKIADAAVQDVAVADVHDVRARAVGHRVFVDLHAVVHPAMTVAEACAVSERVQAAVRSAVPNVVRVLVHVEPARAASIVAVPSRAAEGDRSGS